MTEETQYTDEFFINLTMDYDKRDDNIYRLDGVHYQKIVITLMEKMDISIRIKEQIEKLQ